MKFLRNFIFRASCAIAIGVLLIEYREEIVRWIVITIGVLFFLAGIIALVGYYTASAAAQQVSDEVETSARDTSNTLQLTPFVAVGSIILGAVLALLPDTFITTLVFILAALLIIGSINQYANLAAIAKVAKVGLFYWLMPSILLIIGVVAIAYPSAVASSPFFIVGWCLLLHGVIELIDGLKIYRCRRAMAARQTDEATAPEQTLLEEKHEDDEA